MAFAAKAAPTDTRKSVGAAVSMDVGMFQSLGTYRTIGLAVQNDRQVVRLARLMHGFNRHSSFCQARHCIDGFRQGSFANYFGDLMNMDVVGETIACKQDCIAWAELDFCG